MNKIFLPYISATLKNTRHKYYIEFWSFDPVLKKLVRFRRSYKLNRIKSITQRKAAGRELVKRINAVLPDGYPFNESATDVQAKVNTLDESIRMAAALKMTSDRQGTINYYRSHSNRFLKFCEDHKLSDLDVKAFRTVNARKYIREIATSKKVSPRTYNNYVTAIRSLFNCLIEEEYIKENPFDGIKKVKTDISNRRSYTEEERAIILPRIKREEPFLYMLTILQLYCLIRPIELSRLLIKDFDFDRGVVLVRGEVHKNKKSRLVTIPSGVLHIFEDLKKYRKSYFVAGKKLKPGSKQCGKNALYNRHRKILEGLEEAGRLEDINGMMFYSWKYTGMRYYRDQVSVIDIQEQAGHATLNQILDYINFDRINPSIQNVVVDKILQDSKT